MEIIDVPLMPIEAPLRAVLRKMKDRKRKAVIAQDDQGLWLFMAPAVAHGLAVGNQSLSELENEKRKPVHVLSATEAVQAGLNATDPRATRIGYESFLDGVDRNYALLARDEFAQKKNLLLETALSTVELSSGRMVEIVTRHEGLAYEIGDGPADFYCSNVNVDPPHEFPPLRRDQNGKCPLDGCDVIQIQT